MIEYLIDFFAGISWYVYAHTITGLWVAGSSLAGWVEDSCGANEEDVSGFSVYFLFVLFAIFWPLILLTAIPDGGLSRRWVFPGPLARRLVRKNREAKRRLWDEWNAHFKKTGVSPYSSEGRLTRLLSPWPPIRR
ncbi:hypothetical protein A2673_03280 [Candidatus Kaiserbacteria bacterium RIFCSPHIGHO2_01_FULL_50_13]|uniref:Uncharacterized protein n=1 Tax=Candidatus Kaiserbacteria bacterium RIFCSPLOWO2_01_FULL_50_24 TaxID=1798507 RepID=A0A1F6EIU8_9BACT|nr:MAG: hypothetical protein A2673_03280 [Candidatus Kaiserbacteria bacterium RIFCSPHIGHO2_01_FULL_50_13]OGG73527.1 MAG: hypothetical protein A3A34_01120 [Candidatus Kaiserbacteria bacterium RIFCSPLOWO2_01_FULL_50_24]OGG81575.1 MAG: hypothetical protein A3H74_00655 [Candidatus Kaiserbacteria bacterium RIFCSPLOWO2_02_FULL_51_13]